MDDKKEKKKTSMKTAFDKLSAKHKVFFTSYLECLNAKKAYQKAFPTAKDDSCYVRGSTLLRNVNIQDALKEYYDNLWENREDLIGAVFNKLLNMSNFDISDYIDSEGNIELNKLNSENSFPITEIKRVVRETQHGTDITESIKTVDKLKAIIELHKVLGMIQEKIEHTGTITVVPDKSL